MQIPLIILITLFLTAPTLFSQTALWDRVPLVYDHSKTSQDKLTNNEIAAIRNLLHAPKPKDVPACDIQFSGIALAPSHKTVLVGSPAAEVPTAQCGL